MNPNHGNRSNLKQQVASQLLRHRRLVIFFGLAMAAFIILHRVWFYVMGAFAVIGAVWMIREYNKREDN